MREIYTAPTVPAAELIFADFAREWRSTYAAMIKSCDAAWPEFVPFLKFPAELRHIVYTTTRSNRSTPASDARSGIAASSPTNKQH
jgi:transposase-like protein